MNQKTTATTINQPTTHQKKSEKELNLGNIKNLSS
jgi:hypothetical protein